MKLLEERIAAEGETVGNEIVKVDMFLNHQVDPALMSEIGKEFARLFKDKGITKVITIEVSGIAPAVFAALELNVPMVIAKKNGDARNMDKDVYTTEVYSFTKQRTYNICVSKKYLNKGDKVLIIDDFLANGKAAEGLSYMVEQAGASVEGIGIVIEKGFQPGGKELRKKGYHVESLAVVSSIDGGKITFEQY